MSIAPLLAVSQAVRESLFALRARPGYTLVAVVTLALGVGSSAVVFSVVDAVALAEIPYAGPDRLAMLYERSLKDAEIDRWPVAPATFVDWREMNRSFEALAAYDYKWPVLTDDESAQRVRGILVTGNLFETLGVSAVLGRTLDSSDVVSERAVAVISDGLWTRAFGRDPAIVGREVIFDRTPTRIIGVMPAGFRFPFSEAIDVWRPLRLSPEQLTERGSPELFVVGRLRDDVRLSEAAEEMRTIGANLREQYPETTADRGVNVFGLRENWLGWRRPALTMFAVAAGLALVIACMNLAGLMLSRGLGRQAELAMRRALGANRRRLALLLAAEGWIIALGGGLLGALLARLAFPLLLGVAPDGWAGVLLAEAGIDLRAVGVALVVALSTATIASIVPVWNVIRSDVASDLRTGSRAAGGRRQLRVRRGLVLAQTVLAVFLLGLAGLFGRALYQTYQFDVGFEYEGVLAARVLSDLPGRAERMDFYYRLEEELDALPGVERATLANIAPLTGFGAPVTVSTDGSAPGSVMDSDAYNWDVQFRAVGREFFEMLEIPLMQGRALGPDDRFGAERVAVVNQRFVEQVLGGEEPLGRSFRAALAFQEMPEGFQDPIRIVGVVGNIAEWGMWQQPAAVYIPVEQTLVTGLMHVMLETSVPPERMIEPLRETVWSLGNRLPLEEVGTLESHHRDLYGMHDFMLAVVGAFGLTAVLLASIGLYGVVALQVGQRSRELSVRRALGASRGRIVSSVMREGLLLGAAGSGLATLAALAVAPTIAGSWFGRFLHGLGGFDAPSFALAVALLLVTAGAACLAPARRAAAVEPAQALRIES